jgi:hypothetical protein
MQTHQLCTKQLNKTDPWIMYDYIECNFGNLGVNDYDNTRDCATELGLDPQALWACSISYEDDGGPALFLASVEEADTRGVHSAPTVYLNGAQLASAQDLTVAKICAAYTGSPKPAACTNATGDNTPKAKAAIATCDL